ncbi:MAG: hypothetical protein LUD50_03075, partial [Clostridia bacterium]|nr:hypothetical protein [Clostridia bacterium]
GVDYMFSTDLEPYKKAGHMLVVFGEPSELLESVAKGICKAVTGDTIHERRLKYKAYMDKHEQMDHQEQLPRLERLGALQLTCKDYREYAYRDGDVIYCDIPYPETKKYNKQRFNHEAFYEWVMQQPAPVYFSGYDNIADGRFKAVWSQSKRNLYSGYGRGVKVNECLYTQSWNRECISCIKQVSLFD